MNKPLTGVKIAILVANGFSEADFIESQRALLQAGANARIVSPEAGLVNGWTGESWGHHFAVDANLSTALGADYAMMVVPGGKRSHDKLKLTPHTKRFISNFMTAKKPVALFGDALNVMVSSEAVQGRTLAGPATMKPAVEEMGGTWSEDMPAHHDHVMSGDVTSENRADFIKAMIDFFVQANTPVEMDQAA